MSDLREYIKKVNEDVVNNYLEWLNLNEILLQGYESCETMDDVRMMNERFSMTISNTAKFVSDFDINSKKL